MLIKDKYIPNTLDKTLINKEIYGKLKHISNKKTFNNIFIYGGCGSGKYTATKLLLKELYGPSIEHKSLKTIEVSNNKTIDVITSNHHYEIYFNENYKYDNSTIINFLKDISKFKCVITNSYKIVILKNIQYINKNIYNVIKNISEQYYNNVKFILISRSTKGFPNYMKGFFMLIRIPSPNLKELMDYYKYVVNKENITLSKSDLEKLIISKKLNMNCIVFQLEFMKENAVNKLSELNSIDKKYKTLFQTIESKNITDTRKHLYDILAININKHELIENALEYFAPKVSDVSQLISFSAEIDNKMNKSYRDFFHIEYFIMNMMSFIE